MLKVIKVSKNLQNEISEQTDTYTFFPDKLIHKENLYFIYYVVQFNLFFHLFILFQSLAYPLAYLRK